MTGGRAAVTACKRCGKNPADGYASIAHGDDPTAAGALRNDNRKVLS